MKKLLISATLVAASTSAALAGQLPPVSVSEPGMFGLFAAAIAVAVIGARLFKK